MTTRTTGPAEGPDELKDLPGQAPSVSGRACGGTLRALSPEECLGLLEPGGVGRVGFMSAEGIVMLPVNYAIAAKTVVFRTAPDTLLAARANAPVSFEADRLDEASREGIDRDGRVISWEDHAHGLAVARTMGMVTFALFSLFFSIESKDERDSAFSLGTFSDKTFPITTAVSFLLLLLSTVLGIFQTVMDTTRLDVPQWLICTTVALSIVAAAEIRKAARRQPGAM